jgi:cell division septation protein DedD
VRPTAPAWLAAALLILMLSGCGGPSGEPAYVAGPSHYYPPPGPPSDPWGPYVTEAAARMQLPAQWIRAVMRQESGGEEQATSPAGAMGLMQLMPATYDALRTRYGLGDDPYEPRDNVLAGAAYIREMYERYGAPGFLAAYNAGPGRVDSYLAGAEPLPDETVNYVAAITPHLGGDIPLSGPLAAYAPAGAPPPPSAAGFAAGCDVDAAYDPDHPCRALEQAAVVPVAAQAAAPIGGSAQPGGCDPDAAYQPGQADCQSAPAVAASTEFRAGSTGGWAIQVGAFASAGLARAIAEGARAEVPAQLGDASLALPVVTTPAGAVLYRARLTGLSGGDAADACRLLNRRQLPCLVVQPGGAETAPGA